MWHRATCLVEVKGTRLPAPVAEILPLFAARGGVWLPAHHLWWSQPGEVWPTLQSGKASGGAWLQRQEQGMESCGPNNHLVGKSHISGSDCWGCGAGALEGDRKRNILNSGWRLARPTNLLNLKEIRGNLNDEHPSSGTEREPLCVWQRLQGTQGKHEVLKAFQEGAVIQIHPGARVSPWRAVSALGFPF